MTKKGSSYVPILRLPCVINATVFASVLGSFVCIEHIQRIHWGSFSEYLPVPIKERLASLDKGYPTSKATQFTASLPIYGVPEHIGSRTSTRDTLPYKKPLHTCFKNLYKKKFKLKKTFTSSVLIQCCELWNCFGGEKTLSAEM